MLVEALSVALHGVQQSHCQMTFGLPSPNPTCLDSVSVFLPGHLVQLSPHLLPFNI